jgi:hypothetical protein
MNWFATGSDQRIMSDWPLGVGFPYGGSAAVVSFRYDVWVAVHDRARPSDLPLLIRPCEGGQNLELW